MTKRIAAPDHLMPETRRWWAQVVRDYELEPHHLRLLTLAGEAWDRCSQARERIAEEGAYVQNRWGELKAHPAIAVERDSRISFCRILRELALDIEGPEASRPAPIGGVRGG